MRTKASRSRPSSLRLLAIIALAVGLSLVAAEASAQVEAPPGVGPRPEGELRPREDTYETARGIGMGIGARAGVTGTSALAYNAANLPLASLYHVETMFGYLAGENAFVAGGAIADSITSRLAAGFAFRGVFGGGERDFSGWDGRMSFGTRLADSLSLGASARFMRLRADETTSDGQPIGEEASGFNVDAALRYTPVLGLHIAALAYNMVDLGSSLAPRRVGGGIAYQYQNVFQVGVDTLVDLTTFHSASVVVGGGIEYVPGGVVPLRLGFQHDTGRKSTSLTSAIGYAHQQFGLDLAFRQDFGGESGSQLLLSMRYHVQ